LALYREIARRNAGEPDAGRFFLAWAHAAGFDHVQPGASLWCFATPDERAWWGGLWADRITDSAIARGPFPHIGNRTLQEMCPLPLPIVPDDSDEHGRALRRRMRLTQDALARRIGGWHARPSDHGSRSVWYEERGRFERRRIAGRINSASAE
jgi:hypothetical protein